MQKKNKRNLAKQNIAMCAALVGLAGGALARADITLTPISTPFNSPIGIDYHEPTNTLVMSVNYSSGSPYNFERIQFDGSHVQFSNASGFTDEVKIATVRSGGVGGFTTGDLFTGNGVDGEIVRITNGGATVTNPWVSLPGAGNGLMRGSLYIDRTAVYGGDLIVVTTAGEVWRVDSLLATTKIADVNTHLEGVITVPNDAVRYGPLAGKIIAGAESTGLLYVFDNSGFVATYDVDVNIEDIDLIPANENFFGVNFGTSQILGAPGSQFGSIAGDILLTQETHAAGTSGLFRLFWDGFSLQAPQLTLSAGSFVPAQWEHVTFAPAVVCPPEQIGADRLLLKSHSFSWVDPNSGGQVVMTENVYEGCPCDPDSPGLHLCGPGVDMTFEYLVKNVSYSPPGGNGFSGFQIHFPGPVPELCNQQSPAIGGPWVQNAFSGISPPFGVEWDAPGGVGIMPGQKGRFSFCTAERFDVVVPPVGNGAGFGPAGWGHTWVGGQAFIFHGFQSVPGALFPEQRVLGVACDSDQRLICKKVKYADADDDGLIEVGELINFRQFIVVQNPSAGAWTKTIVEDRFGAELDCSIVSATQGSATLTTQGNSLKEFLVWKIGTLPAGGVATLELVCNTDLNPAGHQEYTSCSYHDYNSGAVLKFLAPDKKQRSFETGSITISVLTVDALGDCDGDGFSDAEELACGTDPHIPAVDRIIDADGTTTAGDGVPGAVQVQCGDTIIPLNATPNHAGLDILNPTFPNVFCCPHAWISGPVGGDDIHLEDPFIDPDGAVSTCPTAIRDAFYQLGSDCVVLDLDGSLFNGQNVACDNACDALLSFHDLNGNGWYNDGEDIVLDTNGNGIFD